MKEAVAKGERVSALYCATAYAELGEREQALEWLGKVGATREPLLVFFKIHPQYDSLHSDPRFIDLARRTGLMP